MGAYSEDAFTLTGLGQAFQVTAETVSGSYFSLVGTKPILGTTFLPKDEQLPVSDPPVVISYAFWVRHFGKENGVIGKLMKLDDQNFRISCTIRNFSAWMEKPRSRVPIAAYYHFLAIQNLSKTADRGGSMSWHA